MSLIEIQDPFHVPSNAEAYPAENVLIDSCDDHNAMNYWLPELGATNASFVLNRNCHIPFSKIFLKNTHNSIFDDRYLAACSRQLTL